MPARLHLESNPKPVLLTPYQAARRAEIAFKEDIEIARQFEGRVALEAGAAEGKVYHPAGDFGCAYSDRHRLVRFHAQFETALMVSAA